MTRFVNSVTVVRDRGHQAPSRIVRADGSWRDCSRGGTAGTVEIHVLRSSARAITHPPASAFRRGPRLPRYGHGVGPPSPATARRGPGWAGLTAASPRRRTAAGPT